jgi:hypothetical protein
MFCCLPIGLGRLSYFPRVFRGLSHIPGVSELILGVWRRRRFIELGFWNPMFSAWTIFFCHASILDTRLSPCNPYLGIEAIFLCRSR